MKKYVTILGDAKKVSIPRRPPDVRLICSVMGISETVVDKAVKILEKQFGRLCAISDSMPFDRTSYYEREMGQNLLRRFAAFEKLIDQGRLPQIKHWTNELEREFSLENHRQVNLDPGYINAERLVLATGKNFTHRIYLGHGIYADLTLVFYNKTFHSLEWTYPDYADAEVISFMNGIRRDYMVQLREESRN